MSSSPRLCEDLQEGKGELVFELTSRSPSSDPFDSSFLSRSDPLPLPQHQLTLLSHLLSQSSILPPRYEDVQNSTSSTSKALPLESSSSPSPKQATSIPWSFLQRQPPASSSLENLLLQQHIVKESSMVVGQQLGDGNLRWEQERIGSGPGGGRTARGRWEVEGEEVVLEVDLGGSVVRDGGQDTGGSISLESAARRSLKLILVLVSFFVPSVFRDDPKHLLSPTLPYPQRFHVPFPISPPATLLSHSSDSQIQPRRRSPKHSPSFDSQREERQSEDDKGDRSSLLRRLPLLGRRVLLPLQETS